MTTNKPEVVAVMYQGGGVLTKQECGIAFDTCCKVETPLIRLSDYEALQAECDTLEQRFDDLTEDFERCARERMDFQAECEKLRKDAEATHKSVKLLNYLFARNIIAMQSAVIEWEKGKGAAAGMQWIWNTLFGPGQIPDEDETDAQAYFDREIEPLDAAREGDQL